MCKSSPAFCADIQRVVLLCSHSESSQSVTGGSGGTEWKAQGEDSSCSDRGVVVLQRRSPTVRSQRESQSTAWHNQLPLTFLCLALPLMWAELSRCSFFLFLSLSKSLPLILCFREDTVALPYHTHTHTHTQTNLFGRAPLAPEAPERREGMGFVDIVCVCTRADKKKERATDCVVTCVWQTIAGSVAFGCTKYTRMK